MEAREALPAVDRQALTQWVEQHCDLNRMLKLAGVQTPRLAVDADKSGRICAGSCPASAIIRGT